MDCTGFIKLVFILISLSLFYSGAYAGVHNLKFNLSHFGSVQFPDQSSFNSASASASSSSDCALKSPQSPDSGSTLFPEKPIDVKEDIDLDEEDDEIDDTRVTPLKLHLKHRPMGKASNPKDTMIESTTRDLTRIQTLHKRITEKKNQIALSRLKNERRKTLIPPPPAPVSEFAGQLTATLESGVSLGSGEYFMDVLVGTPPKHFSLILDTGSDLNWIQCEPCHDCFEQEGPFYNPKESSSYMNIGCKDPRCDLVSSPDPPQPCKSENQTCPYYYWYGDSSNTTGDLAVETFTINLTTPGRGSEFQHVENVMFGCGHWNRGLFHGAAGLLGLGRGPLSFSSQLQSLYGHSFSYCLVDRNSDPSVRSKLIFGEDKDLLSHPLLNFTTLVKGQDSSVDTFYFVRIRSVVVGGEVLKIPREVWNLTTEGAGGTIIDSGTTLSYFADRAYEAIKEAFLNKINGYPIVKDFPILSPCYNVSGVEKLDLPSFSIVFEDGAMWDFPVENYFIRIEPEDVVCLAMVATPRSALSIIGNYQQQNFHIFYDTKKSRLGFAPTRCAQV